MSTEELPDIAGIAHHPDGQPHGAVVLTHGAGGSCHSPMLRLLCTAWAERGWLALRFDMPFRRNRPRRAPTAATADHDPGGGGAGR